MISQVLHEIPRLQFVTYISEAIPSFLYRIVPATTTVYYSMDYGRSIWIASVKSFVNPSATRATWCHLGQIACAAGQLLA
jgi:hypothetical protein